MRIEIENCKSILAEREKAAAELFAWTPPVDPVKVVNVLMEDFKADLSGWPISGYVEIELSNGDMLVFNLSGNEDCYDFELSCNLDVMTDNLDDVMTGHDTLMADILNFYIKYKTGYRILGNFF